MLGFRSFLASEKVKEHIPWSEKKKATWSFCVEHLKILEYLEVQF